MLCIYAHYGKHYVQNLPILCKMKIIKNQLWKKHELWIMYYHRLSLKLWKHQWESVMPLHILPSVLNLNSPLKISAMSELGFPDSGAFLLLILHQVQISFKSHLQPPHGQGILWEWHTLWILIILILYWLSDRRQTLHLHYHLVWWYCSVMTSNQTMSKKPDHDSIVQPMNAATVGGVGVPSGASKSPWGDTFLNRKKFFEENAGQKDEDESEDQPLSRLTVSTQYGVRERYHDNTAGFTININKESFIYISSIYDQLPRYFFTLIKAIFFASTFIYMFV